MVATADVVVIGGGAIGFSTAYHLAKQGIQSQVIEMDGIAAKASGRAMGYVGAAGLMTFTTMNDWRSDPEDDSSAYPTGDLRPCLELGWESSQLMPQLAEELKETGGVDSEYGEISVVFAAFEEKEEKWLKERMAALKNEGFTLEWATADKLEALGLGLNPKVRGAVVESHDGQVEAYRYVLALAQAAEQLGASIRYGQAVGFGQSGQKVHSVKLSSGQEVPSGAVVIAMGPWSGVGTSWLGNEIPLQSVRGSCVRVQTDEPYPPYWPTHGIKLVSPKVDGTMLVGYVEDWGVGLEDDHITEDAINNMVADGVNLIPKLKDARLVEVRAGILGYTSDSLPVLGRLPGWDNVYVAAGLGTFGICLSPAVGRFMADLIAKDRGDQPVDALSPARFLL